MNTKRGKGPKPGSALTARRKVHESKAKKFPVSEGVRFHLRYVGRLLNLIAKDGVRPRGMGALPDDEGGYNDDLRDPLRDHVAMLRKIFQGEDARVVMGQAAGRGRRKKAAEHYRIVVAYLRAVHVDGHTHAKACDAVRKSSPHWSTLADETIRKYKREHYDEALASATSRTMGPGEFDDVS